VEDVAKSFGKNTDYLDLLRVIADVVDYAADGHDSYLTLGTNKSKDNVLMTIKQDGRAAYVSALDLRGLSEACKSVL
jgi:hypothetical protein